MSPLLNVQSNSDLDRAETERLDSFLPIKLPVEDLSGLIAYLESAFSAAQEARRPITERMLKILRARKSEYEPEILAQIHEQGGCDIYMSLTDQKCNTIEAQLKNVLFPAGERNWKIEETPVPELPPSTLEMIQQKVASEAMNFMLQTGQLEVKTEELANRFEEWEGQIKDELETEAKKKSKLITAKVDDNLLKGCWYKALEEIVYDISTFPSCILRGSVYQQQKVLNWELDETGGYSPEVITEIMGKYYRLDPFNFFPEPGIKNVNDGYIFEVHPMTREKLTAYIGIEGFYDENIQQVLEDYGDVGYEIDESLRTEEEDLKTGSDGISENPENLLEVREFTGNIQGEKLIEYGFTKDVKDPLKEYAVNIWILNQIIIKIEFNPHPLGEKNYFITSFREKNDSVWGTAPAEVMYDKQRAANKAARELVNNMGMASGPMVEINVSRLPVQEQTITKIHPWKIFQTTDDIQGRGGQGVHVHDISLHSTELMGVYSFFSREASEVLGVPSYTHGGAGETGSAGSTASGLSMLMNAASIGLKLLVRNIDSQIILNSLKAEWLEIMLYDEDQEIKGDVEFAARASDYLLEQEAVRVRRNEFLQATQNPEDMAIIGKIGRANMLRENAAGLKMEKNVVPSEEEIIRSDMMEQIQMQITMEQEAALGGENSQGTPRGLNSGKKLDAAGNPVSGTDSRLFGQSGRQG